MGSRDAHRSDSRIGKRQDNVAGGDFPHRLIERVDPPIGFSLRGPQITARYLMTIGLVLVDPPVPQGESQGLFATIFPSSTT